MIIFDVYLKTNYMKNLASIELQKKDAELNGVSEIVCNTCAFSRDFKNDRYLTCTIHDTDFSITSWCGKFKARNND